MSLSVIERVEEKRRRVATQAYPKIRAEVLDRHKRLYLASTGRTCTIFMLPVASVCKHDKATHKHDKAATRMSRQTIRSPRTIAYKLAMIWMIRTQGATEQ